MVNRGTLSKKIRKTKINKGVCDNWYIDKNRTQIITLALRYFFAFDVDFYI